MTKTLTTIGFDADDTLWQNEAFFRLTQDRFTRLLSDYAEADHLHKRLLAAERRNLGTYGFGIKGFVLSMIETAIDVTEGRVPASAIAEIMAAGREMLDHPIELLSHAREAVEMLADRYRVILITKGDLLDQERKLAQSGLGDLFHGVEIVSNKTPAVYSTLFARHGDGAERAMMGREFVEIRRAACDRSGWLGHPCAPRIDLGAGSRRRTGGSPPFPFLGQSGRIARIGVTNLRRIPITSDRAGLHPQICMRLANNSAKPVETWGFS